MYFKINLSQSLFYWITYSYIFCLVKLILHLCRLNPYFIGLPILITFSLIQFINLLACLNPYFIGLPILIMLLKLVEAVTIMKSQSLFYWITYSYKSRPSIHSSFSQNVSILILLDYLFLFSIQELENIEKG